MTEERYTVYIGPNYDMIFDNRAKKSYNGITVAEMLNNYEKENQKLSNALRKVISEKMDLEKEIRRIEHEVF